MLLAAARGNQSTYLLSQPISDQRQAEETPKAISQANSGPTRKLCADVAGRAERTHVRSVGHLSAPLLTAVQQRRGTNARCP